jgi:hypothetical protein
MQTAIAHRGAIGCVSSKLVKKFTRCLARSFRERKRPEDPQARLYRGVICGPDFLRIQFGVLNSSRVQFVAVAPSFRVLVSYQNLALPAVEKIRERPTRYFGSTPNLKTRTQSASVRNHETTSSH